MKLGRCFTLGLLGVILVIWVSYAARRHYLMNACLMAIDEFYTSMPDGAPVVESGESNYHRVKLAAEEYGSVRSWRIKGFYCSPMPGHWIADVVVIRENASTNDRITSYDGHKIGLYEVLGIATTTDSEVKSK